MSPARTSSPLSAERRHELKRALSLFPREIRERGVDYARQRRVSALRVDGSRISASVRGTRPYAVIWSWLAEDAGWDHECACPMGSECKHAYAAGLLALTGPSVTAASGAGAGGERTTEPARGSPGGRRARALAQLRRGARAWEREEALELLLGADSYTWMRRSPPERVRAALHEPDPDLRCLLVAREVATSMADRLPVELAPFLERADLAARLDARRESALLDALGAWSATRLPASSKSLRLVLRLAPGADGPRLVAEARVTSARLADAPRSLAQLDQLRADAARTPGLLSDEALLLLDWLTSNRVGGSDDGTDVLARTGLVQRLVERAAASPLARWADDLPPGLATASGVTPGGPVLFDPTPLRLVPGLDIEPVGSFLSLRLAWPDGQQRPATEGVLLSPLCTASGRSAPGLALTQGRFFALAAEPPPEIVRGFRERGRLALRGAGALPVVRRLAARFPEIRAGCEALVRHHRVTPLALVDMVDERFLELRLLAHTGPPDWSPLAPIPAGALLFERSPEEGWLLGAESEAEGGGEALRIDEPEPADVGPVLAWAEALVAEMAARGGRRAQSDVAAWLLPVTAEGLEVFADALDARPEGLPVLATPRARKLLEPGAAPRAKVSVRTSGIDFFEVSAEWEAQADALSDADLATLRRATTRFVKLSSGWVRRSLGAEQEALLEVLADLGIEPDGKTARIGLAQLAGARSETVSTLESLAPDRAAARAARALRERVAEFRGVPPVALPAGLRAELRPYQKSGLDFLAHASSLGVGAILADDMGLGKTLQALAWLLHLRAREAAPGPALVVCPTSVLHNWAREAARFAPGLRVALLERGEGRHAVRRDLARHDLVVTNYALLRRDAEAWREVELFALVLDEAQFLKNPDAGVTRAAQALRARHRLALTGTPLENRALDVWSITGCVSPGHLGPRRAFVARYDQPDAPPHHRKLLAAKLRPLLLRRMKRDVAPDLPDRIEERRDCELAPEQRRLYLAELRRSRGVAEDSAGSPRAAARRRIEVLAALTRLRQICCHPALAGGDRAGASGKFDSLFELLEPLLAEGHKALVFSQFVRCLKLLEPELARRGVPFHVLTGATTERERVVSEFQADPRPAVFLVSLRAGGTGLNLTAAPYVVLLDPWWNPAVEAQAIDRTHRIGQERTVIAYRLVTRGTVEEKILELQQRKAQLASDVLGEEALGRSLTRDDLAYLFEDP